MNHFAHHAQQTCETHDVRTLLPFATPFLTWLLACTSAALFACSPAGTNGSTNTGGATTNGGTTTTGGSSGKGGTTSAGGATATGGSSDKGGTTGTGGVLANGGSSGKGGTTSAGGSAGTGGAHSTGGSVGTGGSTGTGGSVGTGGRAGAGGAAGRGGTGGTTATGGTTGTGGSGTGGSSATSGTGGSTSTLAHFSFFVTSWAALQKLSGSTDGFGGDLRYGQANGLAGADKICSDIAESSMAGSSAKQWRAFLSTVSNPSQVNAKDRVGNGPWYDRSGRMVASTLTELLMTRPGDADAAIKNDLPNENGQPNQETGANNAQVDNHDVLTGTGTTGTLYMNSTAYTCSDWTSSTGTANNGPWVGHSWGAQSGQNWMSALREGGCAPGANFVQSGGPQPGVYTVGTGGGYGGFYCFALSP